MSLVYITHHNENIFDLENDAKEEQEEETSRYVSKFNKRLRKNKGLLNVIDGKDGKKIITESKKCRQRTMGYAETPLDPPCAFLRKNGGVKWQRYTDHTCVKTKTMPPIPKLDRTKKSENPIKLESIIEKKALHCPHPHYFRGHKHRANFIEINIETNKASKPKLRPPRYIDTPKGDARPVVNTGLVPEAVCLKDYGKVPCYLRLHKKKMAELKKRCALELQHEEEQKQEQKEAHELEQQQEHEHDDVLCPKTILHPGIKKLSPLERFEIISGLKENYSDLNNSYQRLSLYTDTLAKRFRKGKLENDLRQLEQDIALIEANPNIFVSE